MQPAPEPQANLTNDTLVAARPVGIDAELTQRVIEGDLSAFETLMRRHNQRLFRAARAVLRDDTEAQDAVQQAWLAVFRHLAQWDGRAAFSTWAVRIAVNEASRRLRARKKDPELWLASDDQQAVREPSPEDDMQRVQLRALLERAIDALPESMRVVLVLRDLSDLSGAEAAEALGLSEEAVRVRLHRARRLLRSTLEETLESGMSEAFPFLGARCDAIVHSVLTQLHAERTSR